MRRRSLVLPVALLLTLTACGSADQLAGSEDPASPQPEEQADEAPADEGALRVVATLPPMADLVRQVGGDRVEVASLVRAGTDSHTFEPSPSDVAELGEADAYLGVGLSLNDAAVGLAREHLGEDRIHLLGEAALSEDDLIFDHSHDDDGHSHEGEAESHTHDDEAEPHTHDEADAADGSAAGEAGPNPHVWTGLDQGAAMVDEIAATLSELDPDGADAYAERAEAAREDIADLDDRIGEAVETIPEDRRRMVAYHDAWKYFADAYGLELVVAVQPSSYAEPSAAEVREVIDLLRETGAPALFGSEEFPSGVLETIAAETGAEYVGELTDDSLPGQPGDAEHRYQEMMRRNAVRIVDGLGGDVSTLQPAAGDEPSD